MNAKMFPKEEAINHVMFTNHTSIRLITISLVMLHPLHESFILKRVINGIKNIPCLHDQEHDQTDKKKLIHTNPLNYPNQKVDPYALYV